MTKEYLLNLRSSKREDGSYKYRSLFILLADGSHLATKNTYRNESDFVDTIDGMRPEGVPSIIHTLPRIQTQGHQLFVWLTDEQAEAFRLLAKRRYEEVALNYNEWAEHCDPGGSLTLQEFHHLTMEQRIEMLQEALGDETP